MRIAWRHRRCIRRWSCRPTKARRLNPGCPRVRAAASGCVTPKRGDKRGLLDLAARNAAVAYQTHFGDGATTAFDALDTLRGVLDLPALPRRIECFDISTFQGRETVASMVVAVEGRMRRANTEVQDPGIDRLTDLPIDRLREGLKDVNSMRQLSIVNPSIPYAILRRCRRSSSAATSACSRRAARSRTSS